MRWLVIILLTSIMFLMPLGSMAEDSTFSTFEHSLPDHLRQWLMDQSTITIAAMDNWPPMNFVDLQGQPQGIGKDLVSALNSRLSGRLTMVHGEWTDIYREVVDGNIDALLDVTPRDTRETELDFTRPYMLIPHVIFAHQDTANYFQDEEDLHGKTVALERGFGNVLHLQQFHPEVIIKEYDGTAEAIDAVARKEVDAYLGNRAVANYIIRTELIQDVVAHGRANKEGSLLTIGTGKNNSELNQIFDLALADISLSEMNAIQQNWSVLSKADTLNLTAGELAWLHSQRSIRLGADPAWPPFEFIDQQGIYRGIGADYVTLIETRLGIRFERPSSLPWVDILNRLENKELDLLPLAMQTEQRREYSLETLPFVSLAMVIVTRDNVQFIDGLASLEGKTVALEQGYASYDIISKEHPTLNLVTYPNTREALKAVASGNAYAYVGNIASIAFVMSKDNIKGINISGETPYRFELSMLVRDDWPELVSILNKVLLTVTDEERSQIFSRWLNPEDSEASLPLTLLATALTIALFALLVTLYWNKKLNATVYNRTQQLRYQAYHDDLTGLPNRKSIFETLDYQLEVAKRHQQLLAVLFLDIDDFKKVNDTQGHDFGDLLLLSVAERLRLIVNKVDTLGRLGGDEFIILIEQLEQPKDAQNMASNLLNAMSSAFVIEHRKLLLSTSIGIAVYPKDGDDTRTLLRNADTAMYVAKHAGGNQMSLYDRDMNLELKRQVDIEDEMQLALKNNELQVVFQPVIDVSTGQSTHFEALMRWHNKKLGDISPSDFIPIAERNGLIISFGNFILDQALEMIARLQKQQAKPYSVAVNLSPRQFRYENLVLSIQGLLEKHSLPASVLVLEITEGVLMNNEINASRALLALHSMGVKIAMDDFGTGYSSISYLRNHPFTVIKVDREFIEDIHINEKDKQLVASTLAMANGLGIGVVAEGVETLEQHRILAALGCPFAQGYYYSKPLTNQALIDWLEHQYST